MFDLCSDNVVWRTTQKLLIADNPRAGQMFRCNIGRGLPSAENCISPVLSASFISAMTGQTLVWAPTQHEGSQLLQAPAAGLAAFSKTSRNIASWVLSAAVEGQRWGWGQRTAPLGWVFRGVVGLEPPCRSCSPRPDSLALQVTDTECTRIIPGSLPPPHTAAPIRPCTRCTEEHAERSVQRPPPGVNVCKDVYK